MHPCVRMCVAGGGTPCELSVAVEVDPVKGELEVLGRGCADTEWGEGWRLRWGWCVADPDAKR